MGSVPWVRLDDDEYRETDDKSQNFRYNEDGWETHQKKIMIQRAKMMILFIILWVTMIIYSKNILMGCSNFRRNEL